MVDNFYDMLSHEFKCPAPQCGEHFVKMLRRLLETDEVVCPKCGMTIDIREAKSTGDIGKDFDTANELNKARQE